MGNQSSAPTPDTTTHHLEQSGAVNHEPSADVCPVRSTKNAEAGAADACPVRSKDDSSKRYKNPKVYNVYSQRVDAGATSSLNNMPATPAQAPAPGQTVPLATERVKSTIPKVRSRARASPLRFRLACVDTVRLWLWLWLWV